MEPTCDQNETKMGPNWDEPKCDQNGTKMKPNWYQNGTNKSGGPTQPGHQSGGTGRHQILGPHSLHGAHEDDEVNPKQHAMEAAAAKLVNAFDEKTRVSEPAENKPVLLQDAKRSAMATDQTNCFHFSSTCRKG